MDNQARTRTKSKKPPARPELEPISYEEIMANAGMSGFLSFLDAPEPDAAGSKLAAVPVLPDAIVSDTVAEPDTVKETATVQRRKPITVEKTTAVEETYTVPAQASQDNRRWKVKRAHGVEDGHSLAEQEVYRKLWIGRVPGRE